jgi:hypothetical protein
LALRHSLFERLAQPVEASAAAANKISVTRDFAFMARTLGAAD